MSSLNVTLETINEFKNNYKKSSETLRGLIEKMEELNNEYSDAMISKAADKYKEVYNEKLKEEKEEIYKDDYQISSNLDMIIKEYTEAYNELKSKVGG